MNSKFVLAISALLSFCFLMVNCANPTLVLSKTFQTTGQEVDLTCNLPNAATNLSSIAFKFNGTQLVYNSTTGTIESGISKKNETTITVKGKDRFIVSAQCFYNASASATVSVPYLNVDEYKHDPNKFTEKQNTTISCKIDLRPVPDNYFVKFWLNKTAYLNYEIKPASQNFDVTAAKELAYAVYPDAASKYPEFRVKFQPNNMTPLEDGKMKCEVSYGTYAVQSAEFDLSKNNSASLYIPSLLVLMVGVLFTPIHSIFM